MSATPSSLGIATFSGAGSAWRGAYLRTPFYRAWGICAAVMAAGMLWRPLLYVGIALLVALMLYTFYEYQLASRAARDLQMGRRVQSRLSLGDDNIVEVRAVNRSAMPLTIRVLDELPVQLQDRDFGFDVPLSAGAERNLEYVVHPLTRGRYAFGQLFGYVSVGRRLIERRYAYGPTAEEVAVYPSVIQMRRQALRVRQLARQEGPSIRVKQFGRSYEFDQIKPYVPGDDYRSLNWKASARANALMLNTYIEEKSQRVIALVDSGRTMLAPFDGLSLLDYAINSTLALLNVALIRGDRVGLVGFDKQVHTAVPVSAKPAQLQRIMERLYAQESTDFEPDYGALYQHVRRRVRGRSLLMLYTNFDTLVSLQRNLPVLRQMSRAHVLVVVMFENARITEELDRQPETIEDAYLNTVAAEYEANQERIAATLHQHGILVMRTAPQRLTADAVSRYLDVKRGGRL